MSRSEAIRFDPEKAANLRKLVAQGEGHHMEFKRRASYPEKVIRELIAFANTDGGVLFVGVDDDGTIPGLKFPEEESLIIRNELKKSCRPAIPIEETVIPISSKKYVLQWRISPSDKRPHYFISNGERACFIRLKDQSLKASREMCEIIRRRSNSNQGTRFTYGDAEQKIIHLLGSHRNVGLRELTKVTGLNKFLTSRKLVRLVLANVLKITPTEKGDVFSSADN